MSHTGHYNCRCSTLGLRDATWEIRKPRFAASRPGIRFCKQEKWAYAELSPNGEGYWPTVVFEMGHETVHLLNPVPIECSNYLEEGVAVAFSLYACKRIGYDAMNDLLKWRKYIHALYLVQQLPGDSLDNARRIRERLGRLSSAQTEHLSELFPGVSQSILIELCKRFPVSQKS